MIDRTGQVALVHSRGFWARMITMITSLIEEQPGDSYWNHMVIGISPTQCVSAEWRGGVRKRNVSDFPGAVWSEFIESPFASEKVAAFAKAQIGKPYAFLDDFLIGVGIILRQNTPAWLKRRLRSGKRWECAELAGVSLQHGGVTHIINDDRPFAATYPCSYAPVWRDYHWLPTGADEPARWAPQARRGGFHCL